MVDGRYVPADVWQQTPVVHSGTMQLPVAQPYVQPVHHESVVSYSQMASIAQSSTTVQPPGTMLPLHSSLVPLQYWVVSCSWASAPQSVLVHENAVVTSQAYVDGWYAPAVVLQQTPAMQSGGSQLPVVQP